MTISPAVISATPPLTLAISSSVIAASLPAKSTVWRADHRRLDGAVDLFGFARQSFSSQRICTFGSPWRMTASIKRFVTLHSRHDALVSVFFDSGRSEF
jgi:hypothetical protein